MCVQKPLVFQEHFIFRTDFLQTNEAVCNFQDIQVQWRMRIAFHEMANKRCHHIAESWGIFLWQSQHLTPLLHRSGTCLNKNSKGSSTASWGTSLAVCWGHDYQHYHDFWLQPAVWGDWMWTNVFLHLGSSKKLFFYPTITVVLFGAVFFHLFAETPKLYTFVRLLNPENTYRLSFHPSLSYPPNWWAGSKADGQGVGPCDLCIFIILGHHWDGAKQQSGDFTAICGCCCVFLENRAAGWCRSFFGGGCFFLDAFFLGSNRYTNVYTSP